MAIMLKVTSRLEVSGRITFKAGLRDGFETMAEKFIEDLTKTSVIKGVKISSNLSQIAFGLLTFQISCDVGREGEVMLAIWNIACKYGIGRVLPNGFITPKEDLGVVTTC